MWGLNFGPPIFGSLFFFFASSFIIFFFPPLTLFTFFSTLHFLHPTISSLKNYFPKLLKLPSLISLNIYIYIYIYIHVCILDPCVLEHFCYTSIFGETHFQTPLFFAQKCHPLPMDLLFLLFMERNIIYHLNGMMRNGSFKTLGPMLHIPTWTSRWVFLWFLCLVKMLFPCFIESLMVRHCHFVVCSCWNLGHCMIDHVVILALEHFGMVVFFWSWFNLENVGGLWNFGNVGNLWSYWMNFGLDFGALTLWKICYVSLYEYIHDACGKFCCHV